MSESSFARGSFGDLIGVLQTALARLNYYTGNIDSDFGGGTYTAVQRFQSEKNMTVNGLVDASTWQLATGVAWPSLFERCLQLTARLEGQGYQMVTGNFDGAGLTWGIIGYTLANGEIRSIFNEILLRDPDLLRSAFGDNADVLEGLFGRNDQTELLAWADSISTGANKSSVIAPWRDGFRMFGQAPLVKQIQRDRARTEYFDPSQVSASALDLDGDLGAALAFDIQVQNGGVSKAMQTKFIKAMSTAADQSPLARRRLLAKLIADSAAAKWRDDVAARKNMLAEGRGIVHGLTLDLAGWGMAI